MMHTIQDACNSKYLTSWLHFSYMYTLYPWQSSVKYSVSFFCVFFLDLPPFLEQLRGPQETCQSREEKAKGRERGREVAVIEKQKSKWRPDSAGAQKKKKKKLWGCHFLILSSNALWRKFVKLDQGRLKLVYKRRQWREEEEECRTPKASEMPSISPTGWYSFFPLFSSSEL